MNFSNKPIRAVCRGISLSPPELLGDSGKFPFLKNVRTYTDGSIESRAGQLALNTTPLPDAIHTIRRINDEVLATAFRLIGSGTSLYHEQSGIITAYTGGTGFSGSPFSTVVVRPLQSAHPWVYATSGESAGRAAGAKMVKAGFTSTGLSDLQAWGIMSPNDPPVATLAGPVVQEVDWLDASTSFVGGGAAVGAIGTTNRINTTISRILYDTGSTGWASIVPGTIDENIQPGVRVQINAGGATDEYVLVDSVYAALASATTISSIAYDSGASGSCTITLTGTSAGLVVNSVLLLGGTEIVRVESISNGPSGIPSLRTTTVGTFAAGATVSGLRSFRAHCAKTHATTETLTDVALTYAITGAGVTYLSKVNALNLSVVGDRPVQNDDEFHISVKVSDLSKLIEGQVQLNFDASTTDFSRNYFTYSFRPNDLIPSIKQTATTITTQQQALDYRNTLGVYKNEFDQIYGPQSRDPFLGDYYSDYSRVDGLDPGGGFIPLPGQTVTGDNQWTELRFKVSELVRVGSDTTRGLGNISAIRISFNTTAAIDVELDSWWVGGTFGPDVGSLGSAYVYCFRHRSLETGARSNPSPPTRVGINPHRQRVELTITPSSGAPAIVSDVFRYGGTLLNWRYIGTTDNTTFNDDYPDAVVINNEGLEFDNYQPFPVTDIPHNGVVTVSGNSVRWVSGDKFNTGWERGTQIVIAGIPYTLYRRPVSDELLELGENAGAQSNVSYSVVDGLVAGQPLDSVWGPYGEGQTGIYIFGCGNKNEPGTLFWTKADDPDSASDINKLEITSPGEPLIAGGMYDGKPFVFSSERMFFIYPGQETELTSDGLLVQRLSFRAQEVANSKGLFSRFALAVGPLIYFLSRDGIYRSEGGEPQLISGDIAELFGHDGQSGRTAFLDTSDGVVGRLRAPRFDIPDSLRLTYYDSYLYFDYRTASTEYRTLIYNTLVSGWFYDEYTPQVVVHYGDEGKSRHTLLTGNVDGYLAELNAGGELNQEAEIWLPVFDGGNRRAQALYSDVMIDMAARFRATPMPAPVTLEVWRNVYQSQLETISLPAFPAYDRLQALASLNGGNGHLVSDLGLVISWPLNFAYAFYAADITYAPRPINYTAGASDWIELDGIGAHWVQGLQIHANVESPDKQLRVVYQEDDGTLTDGPIITLDRAGESIYTKSWTPFIARKVRLVSLDDKDWRVLDLRWIYEPEPDLTDHWVSQPTGHGIQGWQHIREMWIPVRSTESYLLTINVDGTDYLYTVESTGGELRKQYIPTGPLKGKIFQYSLTGTSSGVRVYLKDIEIRVKPWGTDGQYTIVKPFGYPHNVNGALV